MDHLGELHIPGRKEKKDQQILFEIIEKALKKKQQSVTTDFKQKHAQFVTWVQANGHQLTTLQTKLSHFMMAGGLSATILTNTVLPGTTLPNAPSASSAAQEITEAIMPGGDTREKLITLAEQTNGNAADTATIDYTQLPKQILEKAQNYKQWPSENIEQDISTLVTTATGVPAKATLDGHKMNKIYGFFGKEQHLYRYPGDTVTDHAKTDFEKQTFLPSGIAPGLGAFGYFAPSKTQFTKKDEDREKYYIAAQTFLFPGYYSDKEFRTWLKFRKVIVYNPQNGRAVVAVIGDAGPAQWTGKTYGGSPELMHHLKMVDGKQKTEAVVLFVDDPEDKVPLGPVDTIPEEMI